jgi:hypothetical protein
MAIVHTSCGRLSQAQRQELLELISMFNLSVLELKVFLGKCIDEWFRDFKDVPPNELYDYGFGWVEKIYDLDKRLEELPRINVDELGVEPGHDAIERRECAGRSKTSAGDPGKR